MVDLEREDSYIEAAKADVELVTHLLPDIGRFPEAVCFHCEQAAEKMLKQMWVDQGFMPRRSHDISDLLGMAIENRWLTATSDDVRAAQFLGQYGTKFKYIRMRESERGEVSEAVVCCNQIASLLRSSGFQSALIETGTHYLHGEADGVES